jgi:uncharacterized protein (TIGR00661 family)
MSGGAKILWGVCGIGHGHTFRQLPLIEHFAAAQANIEIFAYGESHKFYAARFAGNPRIDIARVAVPFYVGGWDGLDFAATAQRPENRQDYAAVNAAAMAQAQAHIGRPDLVVSDYEPVSASYAYASNAPLVTVDQQSKYLCGSFPSELNGQTYADEVMRLRMFFPRAERRIATSFFNVAQQGAGVELCGPVLGDAVTRLKRVPDPSVILLYLSAQQAFGQGGQEIAAACARFPDKSFHLFGGRIEGPNITCHERGDPRFHDILSRCGGIVTTAGHTLLSEAMHLGIPVYAVPLPLYEQEMNAHVIGANGFGLSRPRIDEEGLGAFLRGLPDYSAAIARDRKILLRRPGQGKILRMLKDFL